MQLGETTLAALIDIITGNKQISPYRSGPQLVFFFNQFGWSDSYGQGFPSRHSYTEEKILELNGDKIIKDVITAAVDPRHYIDGEHDVADVVEYLNQFLRFDGYELVQEGIRYDVHRYVDPSLPERDAVKNIIFAANGPKPEIVLVDAISNRIRIVKNEEYCLIYDRKIQKDGLFWNDLVNWWSEGNNLHHLSKSLQNRRLYERLAQSLGSIPEENLFKAYYSIFAPKLGDQLPALIPQVYLHYDPYTIRQLAGERRLIRQRMDFLLLLSNGSRVVIEVDGIQHYSQNNIAKPALYAEMVEEDRRLKLAGYEVYRFGGYELYQYQFARTKIEDFFRQLLDLPEGLQEENSKTS